MATTQEKVQKAIAEKLGVDLGLVIPSASLIGDLGADSLDLVELTMVMEEEFGVQISDEDAEKFVTVQDVLTFLQEKGVKE